MGNEYVRLLNMAREDVNSSYEIIDVTTDDIPYYQNPNWIREQLDLLGPKRFGVEIEGVEPLDSDNALLPGYVLERLKSVTPIRCDFLLPEDVDAEGYYKDLNILGNMKDEFDPMYNYIKDLWIWNDPIPGKEYVLVCDVAAGRAQDCSAFIVFDTENNNEQVAEYRNNKVSTEILKAIIEKVAKYYNESKISIENNGVGVSICEYFGETINYEKFFWFPKSKHNYVPGFVMSTSTRANGISYMQSMLEKEEFNIKSVRLINELRSFGYAGNKLQALGGNSDDLVLTLVQFCVLQNMGWASSDRQTADGLLFGNILEDPTPEEVAEETRKSKIKRYYEYDFDSLDADNGFQKEEVLAYIKSMIEQGYAVDPNEILRLTAK